MKKITAFLASLFFLALTGFASAEFVDNGDGTITDTSTTLMWQESIGLGDWNAAYSYCSHSGTGGYNDWRLPTLTELHLLVDPLSCPPCIDPIFPNFTTRASYFLTSSVEKDAAWTILFSDSAVVLRAKVLNGLVRCVRGAISTDCGAVGSSLDLTIPCVQYNGVKYILNLKYYTNPALPTGHYWELDSIQEK